MVMQTLKTFDKKSASLISDMIFSMVKSVASNFGVEAQRERCQFSPGKLSLTVSFTIRGDSGAPVDFEEKAGRIGAPPNLWGKKFFFRGNVYTVLDVKPSNRRYPVIATRDYDGASFKFPLKVITDNIQE